MGSALTWTRTRPFAAVAAVTLALAVLARYGPGAAGVIAAATCGVLVVLAVIDAESRRLPNAIVLPAALIVLLARLATSPQHWRLWLGASLGSFAGFLVLALVSRGAIGMGDVKLALLLGAALGGAVLTGLLLGALAGAAAAVVMLVRNGTDARKATLPYGPFLAFGAIATFLLAAPR
jgi:prepilin signal peptidase PulO-like enzyme (type II secretory pathway)